MLNKDVFQGIDIIIYHVEREGRKMMFRDVCKEKVCTSITWTLGSVQAFELGRTRLKARNLTYGSYRQYNTFIVKVGDGSFCNRLFGTEAMCNNLLRHAFLACRVVLFGCRCCGKYQ